MAKIRHFTALLRPKTNNSQILHHRGNTSYMHTMYYRPTIVACWFNADYIK